MTPWQRLARWAGDDVCVDIFGRIRVMLGLAAVCKFTGLTSPLPRYLLGQLSVGLPVHRYHPNTFPPASLGPLWDWMPTTSWGTYAAVETVALVLSVMMLLGIASRLAVAGVAVATVWLLVVDLGGFKHNLWALAVFSGLLAMSPCGARHSVDAWLRRRLGRPSAAVSWVLPLRLMQLQVGVIYLFSTLRKLNDGWSTGHLLRRSAESVGPHLTDAGFGWLAPIVTWTPWYVAGAWLTIAVEAFLTVGFFVPRLRGLALFLGLGLHLWIDLALDVGAYSLVMFAAYVTFIVPTPRGHTLRVPPGHLLARLGPWLDWLGRLTIVKRDGPVEIEDDVGVVIAVDDDAALFAWRRLPLTFVPAFVADGLRRFRRQP